MNSDKSTQTKHGSYLQAVHYMDLLQPISNELKKK